MDTWLIFHDRRICDGVTDCCMYRPQLDGGLLREGVFQENPERTYPECGDNCLLRRMKGYKARFQENPLSISMRASVPKTDTGGQGE